MDAVRDVADLGVDVLERRPHLARDLAVQRGDAVRVGGEAQRHGREPERFGLAELAEREQVLLGDARLVRERHDVAADQRGAEDLVAGGDGRVGGEDGGGLDVRDRVVGRHAVLDERADALDREEGGVALVHVEDVRVDAERLERTDAADAEQQLLADAVLAVAGVERVGEHLDLEQVERNAADVLAPDVGGDRLAVELDLDGDVLAVQAERLGIDALVLLGLATGVVDALA